MPAVSGREDDRPGGRGAVAVGLAALIFVVVAGNIAEAANAPRVPDFSGYWARAEPGGGAARVFYPPESGPGPIVPVADAGEYSIGDHQNAILKPNAAAAVKTFGDAGRAGIVNLPAWSLCWPSSVPLALNLGDPVQFLQTRDQITILYERSMQVRRIEMNAAHPANLKPSWYGHSIGRYENGNTLVIDTIGIDTRSLVDRFGTPRSDKMRVIERYTLSPDGTTASVTFTVEDSEMFTTPWSGRVAYRRIDGPMSEVVCAENNKDAATGEDFPIPVAEKADF